ncbi:MAG: 50S ribosomal protein L24 [Thiotrichales bacterium]|nr:50S ribosomal protein L24 [Thiotrichales bacterium]MCY4285109.1 50S ribosomal protein L24 [Thiotrichales bacterium]
MATRRIRKGDEVVVLAGRNRGQRGRVLEVDAERGRVVVEGINVVKRHTRPNPQKGTSGGIIESEASVHVSNVALFNPITGKGDRIGIRTMEDGRKVRYFKSTDEVVDI